MRFRPCNRTRVTAARLAPAVAEPATPRASDIFRPPYAGRTLVMSIFNLVQTIGFYGFSSWVPTLLIARGIRVTTSLQYSFVIAMAAPLGPLVGMFVADKVERKWQLVTAGICIGTFMFLFAHQTLPATSSEVSILVAEIFRVLRPLPRNAR